MFDERLSRLGITAALAAVLLLSAPAVAPAAGGRGYSRAKAILHHGYTQFRFTAEKGEHARLTVATRRCQIPYPGLPGPCVILTDAGSRIGYAYHVTHHLGSTSFDYGCLNPASTTPAHEVVCPNAASDHLLIDLTHARSASVTLDDVALRAVEIVGSTGPDTVSGSVRGRETLYGTGGADRLEPGGTPNLAVGGAGDDTFVMDPGVKSVVRGGRGTDTLDYSRYPHGVGVSLARLPHGSIENVTGTAFADKLIGNGGPNVLSGGGGDDTLIGGRGGDTLDGGPGTDTVTYAADPVPVRVTFDGRADDGETGERDNVAASIETVVGGRGNDVLTGDAAPHTLIGGAGDDRLTGGNSGDTLIGGPGNDILAGGEGNDALTGGPGLDVLSCGQGPDDRVTDATAADHVRPDCDRPHIYWTSPDNTIGVAMLDGSPVDAGLITGAAFPTGLGFDGAHIYWSNAANGSIARALPDGRAANGAFIPAAQGGLTGGAGVVVQGLHIYWANQFGNTIGRADLDGRNADPSFITGADKPVGLTARGHQIYWTNAGDGTIARANLNGSAVDERLITGASNPLGVAVDGQHIYWSNEAINAIGRANLDGSAADQRFITGADEPRAVDVDATDLYWSNLPGTIGRAPLDGSAPDESFLAIGHPIVDMAVSPPGFVNAPATALPARAAAARAYGLSLKIVDGRFVGGGSENPIAVDRHDDVYVFRATRLQGSIPSQEAPEVEELSPAGQVIRTFPTTFHLGGHALYITVGGLAVTPDGQAVFVVGNVSQTAPGLADSTPFLAKYATATGAFLRGYRFDNDETRLGQGVAVDPSGTHVYVGDQRNPFLGRTTARIYEFDVAGVRKVGSFRLAGNDVCCDLAVSPGNRVFAQIGPPHSTKVLIQEYGPRGRFLNQFRSPPNGMAIGPTGEIFAGSRLRHRIFRLSPSGQLLGALGLGQFPGLPVPGAVGPSGDVYAFNVDQNEVATLLKFVPAGGP